MGKFRTHVNELGVVQFRIMSFIKLLHYRCFGAINYKAGPGVCFCYSIEVFRQSCLIMSDEDTLVLFLLQLGTGQTGPQR